MIPDDLFFGTSLREITLPSTVKKIGSFAFSYCAKLEQITLNEGLQSIGNGAFSGSSIGEIVLPSSVTDITEQAFHSCNNLESVKFEGNAPASFLIDISIRPQPSYTIYYHQGAQGFTSPEWNGYPTQIW